MFDTRFSPLSVPVLLAAAALLVAAGARAQPTACDPDPGTDQAIGYGAQVACDIDVEGDTDFFRFSGSIGDVPQITMSATFGPIDPCIELLLGTTVIDSSCPGAEAQAQMEPTLSADGVYTIEVIDDGNDQLGSYVLELLCLSGDCVQAVPSSLFGYTPVDPCRIVDTRNMVEGALAAQETRHFHTYGDVSQQNQATGNPGNAPAECPFALGEHSAVHINIAVVPAGAPGTGGNVRAFPFGIPVPVAAVVNYKQDLQNISNAVIVRTNKSDIDTPDISVFSSQPVHLVIDVMGYFTQ